MIYVGICDDEQCILKLLKRKVVRCLEKEGEVYQLMLFYDGNQVIQQAEKLDVLFLNIGLEEMDGIEVGDVVYRKNPSCKIIMATALTNRMREAFHIRAFRFLTKPFVDEEIEEALRAVIKSRLGYRSITLFEHRHSYEIPQREIICVASYDSYCEFAIRGGHIMRKETSLVELEQLLEQELFFRIDRKHIVNLEAIGAWKERKRKNGQIKQSGKDI